MPKRDKFISRVRKSILDRHMLALRYPHNVIVAVSGGRDSMSILTVLEELRHEFFFNLYPLYVDHNTGPDCAKRLKLVQDYCKKLCLPFKYVHINLDKNPSEADMRHARWKIFKNEIDQFECYDQTPVSIAVGHTASDRAETFMMFAVRGAGSRGLGSMKPVTHKLEEDNKFTRVIRPLCDVTRDEVTAFVERNYVPYIDDPTNDDMKYTRNYVRNNIIPSMKRLNYNVEMNLASAADILECESDFMNTVVESVARLYRWYTSCDHYGEYKITFENFNEMHRAVQRRLIDYIVKDLDSSVLSVKKTFVDNVISVVENNDRKTRTFDAPGNVSAYTIKRADMSELVFKRKGNSNE